MVRNKSFTSDISDFNQRGAIVSIRLQNFMTYDDCTLTKPAANLNMILGPNGSGKSAIVCAIIVGLAGEVSLTNRAATPAHLVQRGRDWAMTRIELFNDRGKNYVVERKITITNRARLEYKSEWRLNGAAKPKSEIVKLMTDLNIKVDNLCQFLPQDSVAQFVRMSPSDLLTNTLKAAGDNDLVEQHIKLIEYSEDIGRKTGELNTLKESCKHNEVNARRLETEVEKLREREQMIKKKKICDQKVHYARYKEAVRNVDGNRSELSDMENQLKEARQNADPYRQASEACKAEENGLKKVVDDLSHECDRAPGLVDQLKNSIEEIKTKCQQEFAKFKHKEDQERHREQQIRLKGQEIESYECKLAEIRNVDYTSQIKETELKLQDTKNRLMKANSDKTISEDDLRDTIKKLDTVQNELRAEQAVREKRIELVVSRKPHYRRVIDWLARNQDKFNRRIYLPLLCEISLKDPNNSKFLENILSESDLFSFLCEDEHDLRKFTKYARDELRCKINVILMPSKTLSDFESEYDGPSQHRNVGQTPDAYVKDFFEAPEPILRHLYLQYEVHRIPVFKSDRSGDKLELLCNHFRKFYVGNKFFTVMRSRYDNEQVTTTDNIREDKRLLKLTMNVAKIKSCEIEIKRLQSIKEGLDKERLRLNAVCDEANKEWQQLAKILTDYKKKQEEKRRLELRISSCNDELARLQTERIDIDAEREKLRLAVIAINKSMTKDLVRLAKACESYSKAKKDLYLNALLCSLALRNHKIAQKKYKTAMNDTTRLVEAISEKKTTIVNLEKQSKRLCQYAEEKIDGFKNGKLSAKMKRNFDSIEQESADAIEQLSTELDFRIRNIGQDNGNAIMKEFDRENEELREKQIRISELEKGISTKNAAMSGIKETWLPKLKDVIKVIDEHYQDFMQKLNYGGKVELEASNPDDFRCYGIMIMVKYRDNEQLIPLSSTRQSGGERSVATMIYMLALQTKTTVPFRVVDEINQGMDKNNERRVFELLVRTADESSSQYFLVSPKLLHGLNYGDKMQIHIVFNGPNLNYKWESLFSKNDYSLRAGSDDED